MTIQNNQANLKIILTIVGLVLAVVILTTSKIVAQHSDTLMTRKIQVSFIYPLGSNGLHSNAYSNNFSFNYLYGVNGGVNGFELGGIGNYNKGKVKGVQIAGISNINVGSSKGVLLSGISNVVKDSISGVAVSGIVNYTTKSSKGFQLSTINISKEDVQGVQFGVINYAKRIKGIQFGLINIADSAESGASIGLINVVRKGGYFSFEATGGDALHGNLNFKIGI